MKAGISCSHLHTCTNTLVLQVLSSQTQMCYILNLVGIVSVTKPAVGSSLQEAAERLTLFTAEEEIFAFQRTVSRLTEMQTESYWKGGDRSHCKKHMNTKHVDWLDKSIPPNNTEPH